MGPSMLFTICVAVAALVVVGGGRGAPPPPEELLWDNDFGEPLLVECQSGYALHRARNQFSFRGLRWDWECKKISDGVVRENCMWYAANEARQPMVFRCPKRQYMAGVRTATGRSNQIWEVKCCESPGLICPTGCSLSERFVINFDYCATEENVIVGLYSLLVFEECAASRCQLFPGLELKEKPEGKEYPAAE